MAQVKVKYSGEKPICFSDALNEKYLLFTKKDLKHGKREQSIPDGPWVKNWVASCPFLSVVGAEKIEAKKPEIVTPKIQPAAAPRGRPKGVK